ncbi:uncharacterized protein LOC104581862 isoform X3 [Brachypodium distachyon]|uniref:uncharacterized protein LOC104581862 isoform X3 n=1 Tax=Brachypodium distachyon TaxID=15368 RepID=UPI00071D2EED|nr:uncharacterized protein LOC104581862 isoform X3 [Brachypodium distachyon]|eukprot:XP_014753187.1 uncharacterized protein LOC104581862 isoform X3 [Brachypodium distachyon]
MAGSTILVGTWLCPVRDVPPPRLVTGFPPMPPVGDGFLVGRIVVPLRHSSEVGLELCAKKVGSMEPTVTIERKNNKKSKKKKKRNGFSTPSTEPSTPQSSPGSTPSLWGTEALMPVWSVPWSNLPCGCPWPISPMNALNLQPGYYGLNQHLLPTEPTEILVSFKPWLQRFYSYGGLIPCPQDLVSLEGFETKCPLTEEYALYNGKKIGVTTDSGRFVLLGLVEDVVNTYKDGRSWGGQFNKDDLAVQIGVRCYISKVAEFPGTYTNLCKDLNSLADAMVTSFRGTNKIAFIKHLFRTLKSPPPPSSTVQQRQDYFKFLKSHPAFADPIARSSYVVGIVQTYKSMSQSDRNDFERAVKKIHVKSDDWRERVKSDPLWNQVYTDKQRKSKKKKKKDKERYSCSNIGLATFLRHFVIHSPEHTIVAGVQQMKVLEEVDYLLSDFFDDFIADLFQIVVYDFDLEKHFLKTVWSLYDVGEDRKEMLRRIWKHGIVEPQVEPYIFEGTLTQSHVEASTSGQAVTK